MNMQRKIKFRKFYCWTRDFKSSKIDAKKGDIYVNYVPLNKSSLPLDRIEISDYMQFTGLLDKNGKEIYEGDILERIGAGPFCKIVVSWNDKECCFVYNNVSNLHGSHSPLHDNFVNLCDWTYWVVCGNIFENSELIK